MATFQFDLVSPERLVFSGEVEQVDVPGAEGDFGVMAGHAPFITILRPGIMTVKSQNNDEQQIVVLGGFAEVSAAGLTVLAEIASAVEDIDRAVIAKQIKEAEARVAQMNGSSAVDREIWRLDHLKSVEEHLVGTAMH